MANVRLDVARWLYEFVGQAEGWEEDFLNLPSKEYRWWILQADALMKVIRNCEEPPDAHLEMDYEDRNTPYFGDDLP